MKKGWKIVHAGTVRAKPGCRNVLEKRREPLSFRARGRSVSLTWELLGIAPEAAEAFLFLLWAASELGGSWLGMARPFLWWVGAGTFDNLCERVCDVKHDAGK